MEITIQDAVSACIKELRKHYGSESCIQNDMEHIYTPLLHFCKRKGIVYYDKNIAELFISEHQKYWKSEKYAKRVKFGIQRLIDLMETGKINFNRRGCKKYIPCALENLELSEKIIASNKGFQARTVSAIIRHFFCYLENMDLKITDITDQVYLDFFEYRKKFNPSTPRYTKDALVLISTYLNNNYIVKTNIDFSKLRLGRVHSAVIKPYSKDEIQKILSFLEKEHKVRDKTIISLALTTGLRFSDIANLKLSDIDWENKVINIHQKKTGTPLSLPMSVISQNLLAQYILNERPDSNENEIFISYIAPFKKLQTVPYIFMEACKNAEIEKVKHRSFHSLRRTFATSLSEQQVPLSTISQLLGHKNSDYDRPYLTDDIERMTFCSLDVNKLPPITVENFISNGDL